jgi:hypothetical protein
MNNREFPFGKWVITWGVASIPVFWFFLKHKTLDGHFDTFELGNSGELFMVAIVMVSDLFLETIKLENIVVKYIFLAFIFFLFTISLMLYAIVPHISNPSIGGILITNLRDESLYCFLYGLSMGIIIHGYIIICDFIS